MREFFDCRADERMVYISLQEERYTKHLMKPN
jgi:hypothetical protein